MAGRSWADTAWPCTLATLGDVAITFLVCGVAALLAGRRRQGRSGALLVYVAAALLGALVASAFEWYALASGRWSYTDRMPVVPALGVGLWPLLQLTLLTPLSLALGRWGTRRFRFSDRRGH